MHLGRTRKKMTARSGWHRGRQLGSVDARRVPHRTRLRPSKGVGRWEYSMHGRHVGWHVVKVDGRGAAAN